MQTHFYFTLVEKKIIRSKLELNPGSLASQATPLTTRPWLLGQSQEQILIQNFSLKIRTMSRGTAFFNLGNIKILGVHPRKSFVPLGNEQCILFASAQSAQSWGNQYVVRSLRHTFNSEGTKNGANWINKSWDYKKSNYCLRSNFQFTSLKMLQPSFPLSLFTVRINHV